MFDQQLKIIWNQKVGDGYYQIGLQGRGGYTRAKPGQFVMLRLPDHNDPLLRRPFSIHRLIVTGGRVEGIEILYKLVGKGTRMLATLAEGEYLQVMGPLGSAFTFPGQFRHVFIVTGGIGIAPMVFLASFLIERGADPSRCRVFLGGKSSSDILCRDAFTDFGMPVITTTDDGSAGDQCLVTHPVELAIEDSPPDIIYACGPLEMLQCVFGIAEKFQIPCQISIETRMACGLGACLGCAIESRETTRRYLHACLDGPVFDTRDIRL